MLRAAPSPAERQAGLEAASRARIARADMLRRLKAADITLADVWREVDQASGTVAGRTRLGHLIRALPGIGTATGERILETAGLHRDRRLDSLGSTQRTTLTELTASLAQPRRPRRAHAEPARCAS